MLICGGKKGRGGLGDLRGREKTAGRRKEDSEVSCDMLRIPFTVFEKYGSRSSVTLSIPSGPHGASDLISGPGPCGHSPARQPQV